MEIDFSPHELLLIDDARGLLTSEAFVRAAAVSYAKEFLMEYPEVPRGAVPMFRSEFYES